MSLGMSFGIDLGTSKVLISSRRDGVKLSEPTVIALYSMTGEVVAIGADAEAMEGRVPANIDVVRPIKGGVISDAMLTELMLKEFLHRVTEGFMARYFKPTVVVAVPSKITLVEKQAVKDTCKRAGAKNVFIIRETVAAAIGAGIDITHAVGNMIIDIGGGTTDIAVLSMSEAAAEESIKVAGDQLDDDIIRYMRNTHNLAIGRKMANTIKHEVGCAFPGEYSAETVASGQDLANNRPTGINVDTNDVLKAIEPSLTKIIDSVNDVFSRTPPELMADIKNNGIVLTGGGANMHGIAQMFSAKLGVPAKVAENPGHCVADGTAVALSLLDQLSPESLS